MNKSLSVGGAQPPQVQRAIIHAATLLAISVVCVALTFHTSGTQAAQLATSTATSSFSCSTALGGECHFVLYSSSCVDGAVVNGKPTLVCTKSLITEFTLKNGQSKTVEGLPGDFKQCIVKPNERASFPSCARAAG